MVTQAGKDVRVDDHSAAIGQGGHVVDSHAHKIQHGLHAIGTYTCWKQVAVNTSRVDTPQGAI